MCISELLKLSVVGVQEGKGWGKVISKNAYRTIRGEAKGKRGHFYAEQKKVHIKICNTHHSYIQVAAEKLSFFTLPRDPNQIKIWISKLKLKHLPK